MPGLALLVLSLLAGAVPAVLGQAAGTQQVYVLGLTAAFAARTRVPMGIELRPFGSLPAGPVAADPRLTTLPLTPPRLAGGNPRIPVSPPVVRQALDEFVAANPGYTWAVSGPLVTVLPVGAGEDAGNWLNARVASFQILDLTVREALVALRREFDPAYDGARVSMGRVGTLGQTVSALQQRVEEAQGRRLTVRLEGPRVRDVLDAIVLAHGAAGWIVSFAGTKPAAESARVEVVFWEGSSAIAYAGEAPRPALPPPVSRGPHFLPLPLTPQSMHAALVAVARAASRPVGVHLGPPCGGPTAAGGGQVLDLEGAAFDAAVDLVVSHCAGYERRATDGVVNVGPAGTFGKDAALDSRSSRFKVAEMPYRETLFEVAERIGRNARRPGSWPGRRLPPPAVLLDQERPITVDLKQATARQALNAIVSSHGAGWWMLEQPAADGMMRLSMGGPAGWSVSWAQPPR